MSQDLIDVFKADIEMNNLNILNSAVLQEYIDDLKDARTAIDIYNKVIP